MTCKTLTTLLQAAATAALLTALAPAVQAAPMGDPHDIGGTWDRYPAPRGSRLDPTVQARPAAPPPPPLKPEYVAAYQAHQKEVAAANAKGQPIATGYTHCIPDGMPTMMMGMFPMEVLQSKGQVTIIQEAYNQVRRIYLGEK